MRTKELRDWMAACDRVEKQIESVARSPWYGEKERQWGNSLLALKESAVSLWAASKPVGTVTVPSHWRFMQDLLDEVARYEEGQV